MTTPTQPLRLVCRSCRHHQHQHQQITPKILQAWKSTSSIGRVKNAVVDESARRASSKPHAFQYLQDQMQAMDEKYGGRPPSEVAAMMSRRPGRRKDNEYGAVTVEELFGSRAAKGAFDSKMRDEIDQLIKTAAVEKERVGPNAFYDEEETDDLLITNDDTESKDDDMTSLAHGKLEEHREMREYARVAIWEMPLLAKFAKPFEMPSVNQPLRFRYTSYMGEFHPAEKKVVVEFCPTDFGLTPLQADKLRKLVGPRLNPETDIIKMSCESYEQAAANKRYLGDMVKKLIEEAKDPAETFEDIPLDTRHHTFSKKLSFPKEWRLTEERREAIMMERRQTLLRDTAKKEQGVINGAQVIQQALGAPVGNNSLPFPEMASLPMRPVRDRTGASF